MLCVYALVATEFAGEPLLAQYEPLIYYADTPTKGQLVSVWQDLANYWQHFPAF